MDTYLERLWSQLEKCDSSMIWALSTSESQLNLCRLTIERAVVGQIYVHAMYPNGDADVSRDEVCIKHLFCRPNFSWTKALCPCLFIKFSVDFKSLLFVSLC